MFFIFGIFDDTKVGILEPHLPFGSGINEMKMLSAATQFECINVAWKFWQGGFYIFYANLET